MTPLKTLFLTGCKLWAVVSKCSIHHSLTLRYPFLPAWLGGMQAKPSKGRNLSDAEQLKSAGALRFSISQGLAPPEAGWN